MWVTLERGHQFDPIEVTTDAKGRFAFANVPSSTFTLRVKDPYPKYRGVTRPLRVTKSLKGMAIKVKKQ